MLLFFVEFFKEQPEYCIMDVCLHTYYNFLWVLFCRQVLVGICIYVHMNIIEGHPSQHPVLTRSSENTNDSSPCSPVLCSSSRCDSMRSSSIQRSFGAVEPERTRRRRYSFADYVAERHRQHHLIAAAAAAEIVPICSVVVVASADYTSKPRCRPRGCADVFHGNGPETAVFYYRWFVGGWWLLVLMAMVAVVVVVMVVMMHVECMNGWMAWCSRVVVEWNAITVKMMMIVM